MNAKLQKFVKRANHIINEQEEGNFYSNVDILSCLGDLCNDLEMTSVEPKEVIDSGEVEMWEYYLPSMYDETLKDEEDAKIDKLTWVKNNIDKFDKLDKKFIGKLYDKLRDL